VLSPEEPVFPSESLAKLASRAKTTTTVNPPSKNPLNLGNQISDNEPELGNIHYAYRLGGIGGNLVQPYWSVKDQAFIVPDGSSQRLDLYPISNDAKLSL
jgi:hypothetical protein